MACKLVKASPAHVGRLANSMRQIDRVECLVMGRTPKEALRVGLRTSLYAFTVIDEETGAPVAMFGIMPVSLVSGKGVPWFLGSDDVFKYRRDLIVSGKCMVEWWLESFSKMENLVAVTNDRSIRLLRRWGATFGETQDVGGTEFVTFTFNRDSSPVGSDLGIAC